MTIPGVKSQIMPYWERIYPILGLPKEINGILTRVVLRDRNQITKILQRNNQNCKRTKCTSRREGKIELKYCQKLSKVSPPTSLHHGMSNPEAKFTLIQLTTKECCYSLYTLNFKLEMKDHQSLHSYLDP